MEEISDTTAAPIEPLTADDWSGDDAWHDEDNFAQAMQAAEAGAAEAGAAEAGAAEAGAAEAGEAPAGEAPAGEAAQAAAEGEDAAEEDESEAAAEVHPLVASFRENAPGVVLPEDTPEAVSNWIAGTATLASQVETLREGLENSPGLAAFMEAVMQGGDPSEAFRAHYEVDPTVPDPTDDPEAYAAYKVTQDRRARQVEAERAEAKRQASQRERVQASAQRAFDGFVQRHKLDAEEADRWKSVYAQYVQGLPSGEVRADMFDVFYNGMRFKEEVAKARQEGHVAGRNEAINEFKAKGVRQPTGLPNVEGRPSVPQPTTPVQQAMQKLGVQFENATMDITALDWK